MKKLKKAFTLVELLVVISIIALLLAVLMPALARVKEEGRTVVCATNLRNYGAAFYMYANCNNDRCPDKYWLYSRKLQDPMIYKYNTKGKCPSAGCRWHYDRDAVDGSLWPYLRDKNVNLCLTFLNFARSGGLDICPYGPHASDTPFNPTFSYVMNTALWMDWTVTNQPPMRINNIKRAAQCVAFTEANLWTIGSLPYDKYSHPKRAGDGDKIYSSTRLGNNDLWLSAKADDQNAGEDNIATYHKVSNSKCDEGVANVLYVDGHVKARKGLAGYDAYFEYGRPYSGHEKIARW